MTTMREGHEFAGHQPELSARRQATRERLLDAAVQLFGERGVRGSSVEEICERAGFTRGAFYSNFDSKDELCVATVQRLAARHIEALHAAVDVVSDASRTQPEVIRTAVTVFIEAQPKKATELLGMIELRLHALRTPEFRASWLAVHRATGASVARLLRDAVSRMGRRLIVPPEQAMDLLAAVYENEVSMAQLRGEGSPSGLIDQLARVLSSLIDGCPE